MRTPSFISFSPAIKAALLGLLFALLAPAGIAAAGLGNPGANHSVGNDSAVGEDSPVGEDSSPTLEPAYITIANRVNNNNLGTATKADPVTTIETGEPFTFMVLEDRTKTEWPAGRQSAIFSSLDGYDTKFKGCTDTATGESVSASVFFGLIVAEPGQHIRCVFAHNDIATQIRIANRVFNNANGTVTAADVAVALDGHEIAPKQWISVEPGAHSLSFDQLDGYDVTKFTCRSSNGDALAINAGIIDIPEGERVRCVIAQNDIPTRVRVAVVVRDASNQLITPSGVEISVDGVEFADRKSQSVAPGEYDIDVQLDGFSVTKVRCTNGSDRGAVALDGDSVSVTEGAVARCRVVLRPSYNS